MTASRPTLLRCGPKAAGRFAFAALLAFVLLVPSFGRQPRPAAAHPLGNFTVNRYARIELNDGGILVRYVVDMAEIPAFTEIQTIDRDHSGSVSEEEANIYAEHKGVDLNRGLKLAVDGSPIGLTPTAQALSFPEGQAGLKTLRLVVDYAGTFPAGWQRGLPASFRDTNYSDRVGWKEIVVQPGAGVSLTASSTSDVDQSQELTAYPQDKLSSPLDVREAQFSFAAGVPDSLPPRLPSPSVKTSPTPPKAANGFAKLISRNNLSPGFVALALLAAIAWGAAHALGPGHGKTIVAAYLVGERGTARHAVILGLTVTLTHTSTVITLGLFTLYASTLFAAQDLYLWLSVGSGIMVVAMGLLLFVSRLGRLLAGGRGLISLPGPSANAGPLTMGAATFPEPGHSSHGHNHQHPHGQHPHGNNDHGHSHQPEAPGLRGLIALGISGGLLPCPTALVVMLAAIALDRVVYGLVLIFAFSIGLAAVLTGIGLLLVYAKRTFASAGKLRRIAGLLQMPSALELVPLGSALIILVAGALLTGKAISAL